MIAVIDYDAGNLRSVGNALSAAGATWAVTSDPDAIRSADKVILPGVGEASSAMEKLRSRGLDVLIPQLGQPVLGICIGMQLLCEGSEEGNARCLGIFPTKVRRLPAGEGLKIPHMGWNSIERLSSPLFKDIETGTFVYYVHSFAAELCEATVATTTYGLPFSAALQRGNFFGTQFHPEKSGETGALILRNFLAL